MICSPLNLLTDSWLPVRRRSGAVACIRPAQIVERLVDDPVVAFDWPRADFRIASIEFLIGLLATAFPAAEAAQWVELWHMPPSVEVLDLAFARVAKAFWLDGPGARFLQDHDDLASGSEPVERLLIEAPGDSTLRRNADLFVHRGQVTALGRPAAAIALFTLQSWAPSGGAGNMTGLRGGGPLVSLVLPREGASLWQVVWANTPCGQPAPEDDLARVFPWLAPTLVSGKAGTKVRAEHNAHPLQCWWGMPRRIRLDFGDGGSCDLTGRPDGATVTGWRQRPYGASYDGWTGMPYGAGACIHPLTPRYRQKPDSEWLSVHPQPGGIGYRHWVGVVVESGDGSRLPASAVAIWRAERARDAGCAWSPRLLAAGFDMDNMKARGFVESEMPLPGTADPVRQQKLDGFARDCVEAADLVASVLRGTVREALFGGATVSLDATSLSGVRERFWAGTSGAFFDLLNKLTEQDAYAFETARAEWVTVLRWQAMARFDAAVQLSPDMREAEAMRAAQARHRLRVVVSGFGKEGGAIMRVMNLPVPESKKPTSTRKRA
ncbi:type I-E CRISPR-associated protein Cse1/CasA [Gluconacetobacter takamatsuzukensis]|uniref:Type I-E CRISPR-associated protein Cse1/CasA n=1 Tax=Gluconacetobacter takamatsuzukensis TaxID=1286190 RepID=A0A7W4KAQ7_9PROT|nr:type I-E CRISPR-associated protein Cse1/CasA [Gluconacetobacter takamatsuzukensis]MBB2203476.1 type I-E CRISPR-associated protein Cse1/CasA [Gluconacetobacter takamatsuzukensis]